MSTQSTPPSTPTGHEAVQPSDGTSVVPASVNDMFDLAAPAVEAPLVARLVPVSEKVGGVALTAIPLHQDAGTVVIGRSNALPAPFRIDGAAKLSGQHCSLAVDAVTLRVCLTDTSANGTYVNGTRVTKGEPVTLHSGDSLSLTRPAPAAAASDGADVCVEFVFQRLKEETDAASLAAELTCGVCLRLYHRPVSLLPCMHVFCAPCISQWLGGGKDTCPDCRQPIGEVRPTHKIQSCVDQLLRADPRRRRDAKELRELDELDDIPPAGKVVNGINHKRGREGEDDEDGYSDVVESDELATVGTPAGPLLSPGVNHRVLGYNQRHALSSCPQCVHASSLPGHFQCVPGAPHLVCSACQRPFPERPLCGRPQRCHLCSSPNCHLYYVPEAASGATESMPTGCPSVQAGSAFFGPLATYSVHAIPPNTFRGNTTELSILTTYFAGKDIHASDAWQTCLEHLADGTWVPDLPSVNGPVSAESPVCRRCASNVFAALLFHARRAIPAEELPESVTRRSNCWYGLNCRTQFHNPQHAQGYNHVCYQEKRKE